MGKFMTKYTIAVHGTGFIGLVSGCCFAIKGFKSINSTYNKGNYEKINSGVSPFFENGLDELLKDAIETGNFKCVIGRDKAVENSDVSMIAVGTPMRDNNNIDLEFIKQTAKMATRYHFINDE